jgi:hypothetical protein
MSEPVITGWLRRDGDGVTADLVDVFGMVTRITGVPETREGVRGYALTARLVSVPESLAIPWLDDPP